MFCLQAARRSRRWRGRFPSAVAGFLVAFMVSMVPVATPAGAATATVSCVGASLITYSPGLTLQTKFVSYQERDLFSACGSSDPNVTSGFSPARGGGPASCLYLPVVVRDPGYTIRWNNGRTSTLNIVYTDTIVGGTENVNAVGNVVAGEFTGGAAVIVWAYPLPNILQCLIAPGVVYETGPLLLQITSL